MITPPTYIENDGAVRPAVAGQHPRPGQSRVRHQRSHAGRFGVAVWLFENGSCAPSSPLFVIWSWDR